MNTYINARSRDSSCLSGMASCIRRRFTPCCYPGLVVALAASLLLPQIGASQQGPSKIVPVNASNSGSTSEISPRGKTSSALISDVSLTPLSRHVLVRVEGQGHFDAQPFRLANPDRLVFDFADTHLAKETKAIGSGFPPVRSVRLSQRTPDVVRVVVELDFPAAFHIVPDGSQLLISFDTHEQDTATAANFGGTTNNHSQDSTVPTASAPANGSPGKTASPQNPPKPEETKTPSASNSNEKPRPTDSGSSPSGTGSAPSPAGNQLTRQVDTPFGTISVGETPPASASPQAAAQKPAPSQPVPATPQSAPPPNPININPQKPQMQATEQNSGVSTPNAGATPSSTQQPSTPDESGAAPQTPSDDKQPLSVALNLENADLYQVLRIIGTELRINYVVDPAVKGTVTINTSGFITRGDLFSVLESILQINGAAIVKQDGYYRVVPAADARVHPVPLQFAKTAEMPPSPGQTLVLQVFPMHYVSAAEMSKVLAPFISPVGQVVVSDKSHILMIMETPPKLKQISDILGTFDNPTFSRQRVRLFSLSNSSAKNIISALNDIFGGYSMTGSSAIRFVPIEGLNAVLAISPSPEVFSEVETWIHQLDQPAAQAGEQNFVYLVQNAKASDLRDILIELYGGSIQKPQPQPTGRNLENPMVPPAALEEAQRAQAPQVPERIQGRVHIMSDEKNNALIIQASAHDYEIIKHTLLQLDILPRQVLIDAKIYSVDLTGNLSLGVSYYLNQQSQLPGPLPLSTWGSFAGGQSPASLIGATFAIISQTRALQMFLTATEQRSRVRVLSAPSILVTDNTNARIQVGSSVPIPIGSSLTPVQSNGSSIFAQTIQYQDTGVILTVTPHINASGVVMLTLTQEVSSAVPNSTSQIVAPVINKSSFQTSVVLADGEPLALGGIITTSNTVSKDRIPGLGDLPYVGALFGTTSKKTERNEIVLILTPHVMQNLPQAVSESNTFLQKMLETKKQMDKEMEK